MTTPERFPLSAYAYEVIVGDEIDGRTVTAVDDPDRPATQLMPMGPGAVSITYADGETVELDRMSEVYLSRDATVVLARLNPTPEGDG